MGKVFNVALAPTQRSAHLGAEQSHLGRPRLIAAPVTAPHVDATRWLDVSAPDGSARDGPKRRSHAQLLLAGERRPSPMLARGEARPTPLMRRRRGSGPGKRVALSDAVAHAVQAPQKGMRTPRGIRRERTRSGVAPPRIMTKTRGALPLRGRLSGIRRGPQGVKAEDAVVREGGPPATAMKRAGEAHDEKLENGPLICPDGRRKFHAPCHFLVTCCGKMRGIHKFSRPHAIAARSRPGLGPPPIDPPNQRRVRSSNPR